MRIVDSYSSNNAQFYTVELEDDVFVDVKCVGNLYYVMSCDDGYDVYNSDGNTFDYAYDANAVIELVKAQKEVQVNMKNTTYIDEEFRRDIVELRELRERLSHIPRKFKQYDILLSRYKKLLRAASGKYHMDTEDIVLNFYNV